MSVLDRSELEASPLADLHLIASELSIDGYRRLRRADLIAAILHKQGTESGDVSGADDGDVEVADEPATKRPARAARSRRSTRTRAVDDAGEATDEPEEATVEPVEAEADEATEAAAAGDTDEDDRDAEPATPRRRRGRRGGRGRGAVRDDAEADADGGDDEAGPAAEEEPAGDEELVEGVVELLANGSGFLRVDPPDPSDDDVYISAAQVKRCELVAGDRVAGPRRAPRRSERFASLIRIETINGRPASELADGIRFDDLPARFPTDRLAIGSEDPTLKAIEWLTPLGKGSRATIVGGARSGKSEALRRLAAALAGRADLTLSVVLAGVRPEEISSWVGDDGLPAPAASVSFAASEDAAGAAIEPAIDQARRLAARGADAVVLIDTLDSCGPTMARKALASARNIVDGGSLTVIATATHPVGGETTVIALDHELTSVGRFPAIDIFASGTLHPELLVGEEGADAIARMRVEALEIAGE